MAIGIGAGDSETTITVTGNWVRLDYDEGLWFNNVEGSHLDIEDNTVVDYDGPAAVKIVNRPESVNGETEEENVEQVVLDANDGIETVYLQWLDD